MVGEGGQLFAQVSSMDLLTEQAYQIQLTATNKAGLSSEVVSGEFYVETQPPTIIAGKLYCQ